MKVDSGNDKIVIKGNEQSNELVDEIINERRLMMLKGIGVLWWIFTDVIYGMYRDKSVKFRI